MENQLEKQNQLILVDEDGTEVLCNILFTFDSDEFGKSYVLFSPVSSEENEDGEVEVAAASYIPQEDGSVGELNPIETDEEWELVESVLAQFDEDQDEDDCECYCVDCGLECDTDECDCEGCSGHHHH